MSLRYVTLLCLLAVCKGSQVFLHQTSDTVQPLLTATHNLRCSLNDTQPGGVLIGRRDVTSVTSTIQNVKFVTSILITRDGKDVASVSEHVTAHAQTDLSNLQVTGAVTNTPGERGYLSLTWMYPTKDQAGSYFCQIHAIDDSGHHVVYSSTAELTAQTPGVDDLISHIHKLQLVTSELGHIEHGELSCDDSPHWPLDHMEGGSRVRALNVTHTFTQSYLQAPIIQYGVTTMDHCVVHTAQCVRYQAELVEVTKSGFKVKCSTWGSPYNMRHLKVTWTSIPQ